MGIRREGGCETTLQSCNMPLSYQGLLVNRQGGKGLGKEMVTGLGGGQFVQSQAVPSWDLGP